MRRSNGLPLNYAEGWYEGNADKMESALSPDLATHIVRNNPQGQSMLGQMTAMALVQGTRGRAKGRHYPRRSWRCGNRKTRDAGLGRLYACWQDQWKVVDNTRSLGDETQQKMTRETNISGTRSLTDLPIGIDARVTAVHGTGRITRRLMEMGVVPGVDVQVIKAAPFGDPIEVRVRGYNLAMRRSEADAIEVTY